VKDREVDRQRGRMVEEQRGIEAEREQENYDCK